MQPEKTNKYSKTLKKKAIKYYQKHNKDKTQTFIANKFGISVRTLMRWVGGQDITDVKSKSQVLDYQYLISDFGLDIIILNTDTGAVDHLNFKKKSSESIFKDISKHLIGGNYEDAVMLCNKYTMIAHYSHGIITCKDGKVYYGNSIVDNSLSEKLVNMINQGKPKESIDTFSSFMERLLKVEDKEVVNQLYNFLKHNSIKVNKDGTFTGYRAVTSMFTDKRTGTFDNSVGNTVIMPRSEVENDPSMHCSNGLHVGSLEYAIGFANSGDKLIKVIVDPMNVVSVPEDYNGQKLRCCEFKVIEDVSHLLYGGV